VSAAGDVNGDGFGDLIVGAYAADPNGSTSGASYVVFGGNFTNAVTFLGTSDADALTSGTSAAERFVAGNGDDTMTGGGGADVFYGGQGDDTITVSDLTFQMVDGGSGGDTLALSGSGMTLDLAAARGHLADIEVIDLTGSGDNTLKLTALDLLNVSETYHGLAVQGNAGDAVDIGAGWADGGSSGGFHLYTQGRAVLLVGVDVAITIA
jgi:Ca2+-binding RTX toxin-like protein